MKIIKKITIGFVVQNFTENGEFLSQEFVAGDDVDFEDENDIPVEINFKEQPKFYYPFSMCQD